MPVHRAMRVLSVMAEREGHAVGVRELARELELSPSAIYQLLLIMEDAGMVRRDQETKQYSLTLEFFRLASKVAHGESAMLRVAVPICRDLAEETGEAVYLAAYDPSRGQFMYVHHVVSRHPVNYVMACYEWLPLYSGAGSMAILAGLPKAELEQFISGIVERRKLEGTRYERSQLEAELEEIKSHGYVVSLAQRIAGAVGIGSAIVGHGDFVHGAVVLALPLQRFEPERGEILGEETAKAARQIGEALGG